jgi:hypothetical protein
MAQATRVVRNLYRDSVSLMQLADRVSKLGGVERAAVLIASAANVGLMRDAGALAPRSIEMATAVAAIANLALISTPGEHAAAEAMKALRLGGAERRNNPLVGDRALGRL